MPKRRIPPYNPYPSPAVSVRHAVVGLSDSALTSGDTSGFYEVLKDRTKIPVKLLKFAEDVRPGYIGMPHSLSSYSFSNGELSNISEMACRDLVEDFKSRYSSNSVWTRWCTLELRS